MNDQSKISAVWVYWAGGAEGEELRFSMRSVSKHFIDLENVVLCGDVPEWFGGAAINSPRFDGAAAKATFGSGRWCKWIDSIVKLLRICADPRVTDRFVWLYDDTIFLRPITAAELAIPRAGGQLCANTTAPASGKWREVLRRTTEELQAAGLPSRNYSHHGPVVYSKSQLLQTIAKFLPVYKPRAIESLYLNHWTPEADAVRCGDWLQYTKRPRASWAPRRSAAIANFGSFTRSVERVLANRFPTQCAVELDHWAPRKPDAFLSSDSDTPEDTPAPSVIVPSPIPPAF